LRLARKFAYDGADFEDGDTLVSPGAGAIAATRAYHRARVEAKRAMGRSPSKDTTWDPATMSLRSIERFNGDPPDRSTMPKPTIEQPVPASREMLARYAAGESVDPKKTGFGTVVLLGGIALGAVALLGKR
jgi:hypothetical protein